MRRRTWTGWLALTLWLGACAEGNLGPDDTPAPEDSAEELSEAPVPEVAPDPCKSATQWRYDPLGSEGLTTLPDDIHTALDDTSATGRRVAFSEVHAPWLEAQEEAVTAVYRSLEGLEGWGITAPIILRFTGPLGEVPAWEDSLTHEDIWLGHLSDEGPVRHPFEIEFVEQRSTMVIWPLGVLEPSTEYALLVRSSLKDAEGACVAASDAFRAMLDDVPSEEALQRAAARIEAYAEAIGLFTEELAAGVTFTTQRSVDLSLEVADHIATQSFSWSDAPSCEVSGGIKQCERHYTSHDYRDAEGFMTARPVSPWELVVSIWMPAEGSGPWPTLLMGHGINSNRGMGHGIAKAVSDLGIVVVAVDAIGHGDHPTNEGTESFTGMMSFLGIDAVNLRIDGRILRDNLRQSTADRLQLLELLVQDGDLDADGLDDVDEALMGYAGISLGGIMGSEILALSERLDVAMLITAGARMTSIFTHASNLEIFMEILDGLSGSESDTWQVISAIQGAIDPGDPMAYAPHVIGERLNGGAPPHVLVTMAVGDPVVPNTGTRALAQGLGVEVMHPVVSDMGLARLARGDQVHGNLPAGFAPTTGALFQFDRVSTDEGPVAADHDNTPYSPESVLQMRHFLSSWIAPETSSSAAPEIIDPYLILGTPTLP